MAFQECDEVITAGSPLGLQHFEAQGQGRKYTMETVSPVYTVQGKTRA